MIDYVDVVKRLCKKLNLNISYNHKEGPIYIGTNFNSRLVIRDKWKSMYAIWNIKSDDVSYICKKIIDDCINGGWWCYDRLIIEKYPNFKGIIRENAILDEHFYFPKTVEELIINLDLEGY